MQQSRWVVHFCIIKNTYPPVQETGTSIHFRYRGEIKTFELDIFPDMSSHDIHTLLHEHIEELMEQKPFKGKYIDLEIFQNIGSCIDWRALLEV